MNENWINVFIADDHGVVRDGLKMVLESQEDIRVVGETGNGLDALQKIVKTEPHVALLDINMPEMNGLEVAREVLKQVLNTKIIILSMYSDEAYVLNAIKVGVFGYLLKQSDTDTLIEAIRSVNSGKPFYSPTISSAVLKAARLGLAGEAKKQSRLEKLSPREIQVLQLLAEGYKSKAISEKLFISDNTVNKHRQNIMNKLDIHDAIHLTRFAMKEGLMPKDKKEATMDSYHFTIVSKVYINPDSVGRKILSIDGVSTFKKYLGYSEKEIKKIFDIGVKYESVSEHPYLAILGENEKEEIRKGEQMMSQLYDQVAHMTIEHSNTIKSRTFVHKDGHAVPSITDDFFSWEDYKAYQKIRFLPGEGSS